MIQIGLLIFALIPFSLSLMADWNGPQARNVSGQVMRPALVFDQYLVNLGPVQPQRFVKAYFRFRNTSQQAVQITELVPSCGCLNPQLEKRDYAPNEVGEFFVRVDTALQKPGLQEFTVRMHYDDTQPREVELTFKVTLPEKQVLVRPKALVFYQSGIVTDPQRVSVIDYRVQPLSVNEVSTSSKLVVASLLNPRQDQEGNTVIPIDVRINGAIPPGQHRALITIRTDDTDYPQLQVPLMLQSLDKPSR